MSDPSPTPDSGTLLSRYRLGEKLGQGGMGVVYRAFDTRLERSVALKLLPPEAVGDADRRERFVREAKAASALHHAHIVTVFDIDRVATESGEVDLIAMELVEGEPLDRRLERGALPMALALELAVQMTDALAVAHKAGIVHRDVKPGNLMLGADGNLKLLDFGLSRFAPSGPVDALAPTVAHGLTTTGAIVGTPAYMSPEQAEGKTVGPAADVFAAGAVLYEMVTGRRPFAGDTQMGQLLSVLRETPPPLRTLRPEAPAELERIVARCLAKDPSRRYASAVELHAELRSLVPQLVAQRNDLGRLLRRPAVAIPLALVAAGAIALGARAAGERRALAAARARLPELERLIQNNELVPAWSLARELEAQLGADRELTRLRLASTVPFVLRSTPAGAQVAFRGYLEEANAWKPLGTTPVEVRLPLTAIVFRLEKPGFLPFEGFPGPEETAQSVVFDFELSAEAETPPGMLRIPSGRAAYSAGRLAPYDGELPPFWLGRTEVTNAEFQKFVDAGGYRDPSLWREPFVRDGKTVPLDEALRELVDRTGRPGPSAWELGTFPQGTGDQPVGGVSWYEAAAFARFAHAELPAVQLWLRAAEPDVFSEILQRSRFGGDGPVAVGSRHALSAFGNEDMAGNVFEWTSSVDGAGRRYVAGGAWNEPSYTFTEPGAISPFDRAANRGFRLARYDGELPAALTRPVERSASPLDWHPVDDRVFAAFRGFYAYAKTDLRSSVDSVDDASPNFRWERVSFDAAYGGERIPAHLLLPKNAAPPYQAVVYFPPSPAERFASSQTLDGLPWFEFLARSGRAVVFPIYQNTYERRIAGWQRSITSRRDVVLQWSKDLGRTIDYLESRADIDSGRIAFYGFSLGAVYGPVLTAVEPRIRVSLLLGGGVTPSDYLPEVYPVNFAPRVTIPTLMLTGRDDFVRPVATYQTPLLQLLGTPPDRKRLVELDGGHIPSDMNSIIREALAWLDRWLGPVETAAR